MLELRGLSKGYEELVIDDLSIIFPNVGLIVITGASGCGKTTLLNIIGGIDQDYQGEVLFDHQNIREIKNYCRKHIGFIFQNFNLVNWLNVKNNYLLPKFFVKTVYEREIEDRKEKLGLTKFMKKKVKVLSGGQKQRVALLRAMIKSVDILLCDEPTGSLDNENAKMIFELLKKESRERLVIVITHDENLASHYADMSYSLKKGKLMGRSLKIADKNFYCRLKAKRTSLNLYKLSLLQFRANFMRNMKIITGVMIALICITITFTLSGSLQKQIKEQLNNIFPNQLVSIQTRNKRIMHFDDLIRLKDEANVTYVYGEMEDYEFMGVSLKDSYNIDEVIYINDMTKELKSSELEMGDKIKEDNEVILSKTTANHLKKDYKELLDQEIYGYYLSDNIIKKVSLKVVGISSENTLFDTLYINELANINHVESCFEIDRSKINLMVGMINIDNRVDVKKYLKELHKNYPDLEFKVAGENISIKINDLLKKIQMILILFSSLAVVAACFLIGEVLYLSVVEKTKDIGIFKCLGASKLQLRLLVLLESFTLISVAYIFSIMLFYQFIDFINNLVGVGLQLNLSETFIQIDYRLLIIIYLGALFFGFLSSYFPARFASCLDPVKSLKFQRY